MIEFIKRMVWPSAVVLAFIAEPGEIEGGIFPPAVDVKHVVHVGQGNEVCVATQITRARSGLAVSLSWSGVQNGRRSFLSVTRPNRELAERLARDAKPGERRKFINCHIRPPKFGGKAYKVFVKIDYEIGRWRPWDVARRDPPISVPAL